MVCVVSSHIHHRKTLMEILTEQALTTGLLFALDAGDSASYDGTSQVWSDTSGAGNHFNRGTTSGADATDPTFNGTAGGRSENEYFSHDGGDYFTLATGTFDDGWSKNNGAWTGAVVMWPNAAAFHSCMGNANASADDGTLLRLENTLKPGFYYDPADAAGHAQLLASSLIATAQKPNFIAGGWDEATTTIRLKVNTQTIEASTSASASSLTNNPEGLSIGAWGDGRQIVPASTRIYMAMAWSRLLTAAELNALGIAIRHRFPTMP
jgi:hypothetical protein